MTDRIHKITLPDGREISTEDGAEIPADVLSEDNPNVWKSYREPDASSNSAAEQLARDFHETYERLAPGFHYDTRSESAVPWDEVPEPNRSLMIAVAQYLIDAGRATPNRVLADLRAKVEALPFDGRQLASTPISKQAVLALIDEAAT
jgi:hypothetical protein